MKVDQLFRIETVDWTGGQIKVAAIPAVQHPRIWAVDRAQLFPMLFCGCESAWQDSLCCCNAEK